MFSVYQAADCTLKIRGEVVWFTGHKENGLVVV